MSSVSWPFDFPDAPDQPKTFPQQPDRKTRHGEVKMGDGIQRVPGVSRWIHELTGKLTNSFTSSKAGFDLNERDEKYLLLSYTSDTF